MTHLRVHLSNTTHLPRARTPTSSARLHTGAPVIQGWYQTARDSPHAPGRWDYSNYQVPRGLPLPHPSCPTETMTKAGVPSPPSLRLLTGPGDSPCAPQGLACPLLLRSLSNKLSFQHRSSALLALLPLTLFIKKLYFKTCRWPRLQTRASVVIDRVGLGTGHHAKVLTAFQTLSLGPAVTLWGRTCVWTHLCV